MTGIPGSGRSEQSSPDPPRSDGSKPYHHTSDQGSGSGDHDSDDTTHVGSEEHRKKHTNSLTENVKLTEQIREGISGSGETEEGSSGSPGDRSESEHHVSGEASGSGGHELNHSHSHEMGMSFKIDHVPFASGDNIGPSEVSDIKPTEQDKIEPTKIVPTAIEPATSTSSIPHTEQTKDGPTQVISAKTDSTISKAASTAMPETLTNATEKLNKLIEGEGGTESGFNLAKATTFPTPKGNRSSHETTVGPVSESEELAPTIQTTTTSGKVLIKEPLPTQMTTWKTPNVSEGTKAMTTKQSSEKLPSSFLDVLRKIRKELDELLAWKAEHERKIYSIATYLTDTFKQGTSTGKNDEHGLKRQKRSNRGHDLSDMIYRKAEGNDS